MTPLTRIFALSLVACAAGFLPAAAQSQPGEAAAAFAPLFASSEVLELTMVADFARLERDRGAVRPERPGVLRLVGADGAPAELDVQLRTRGNFRLRRSTCAFPNLRLRFRDEQAARTVFDGIRELKLVAHCADPNEYEQNTVEEYLVYRLYNLLTDASFQVRLARLTYVDINGAKAPITRYGFLIESAEMLAARLGATVLDVPYMNPLAFDPFTSARLELFQYMIGNTDFSIPYFHNAAFFRLPDGAYHAIPFDFDFSGVVDPPYASPDPALGTRSVRERVYRGFCRAQVEMAAVYASFIEHRAAFEQLFRQQPALDARGADRAVAYLAEFFRTIESPRAREARIERRCRTVSQ